MNNYKHVLTISPNYKLRKGGIASVLQLYSQYIGDDFCYSPSIYFQNPYLSTFFFPINLLAIFCKILLRRDIKIIHIHGSHGGSFFRKYVIFWIGKKILKKRVIYHLHSSDFKIFYNNSPVSIKQKINYLISKADVVIVLSEEWKAYILSKFKPKRIKVLENIVEKQKNINLYNKAQKTNLLFLGRIGERKGIYDLIDCISSLEESVQKRIILTIGGDGEVEKLLKKIKDLSLNNVHFVGWIKGDNKSKIIQNSDIFILPSYNEGLPISLLEAMSYGKPIISTNVGGIPRILKNELNGYMIEPGNKLQLSKAILSYVENKQYVEKHGKESLKIVKNYYPEEVLSKLNSIYSEIL